MGTPPRQPRFLLPGSGNCPRGVRPPWAARKAGQELNQCLSSLEYQEMDFPELVQPWVLVEHQQHIWEQLSTGSRKDFCQETKRQLINNGGQCYYFFIFGSQSSLWKAGWCRMLMGQPWQDGAVLPAPHGTVLPPWCAELG